MTSRKGGFLCLCQSREVTIVVCLVPTVNDLHVAVVVVVVCCGCSHSEQKLYSTYVKNRTGRGKWHLDGARMTMAKRSHHDDPSNKIPSLLVPPT